MINKVLFSTEITKLAKWFAKSIEEENLKMLYEILSEELSDREFEEACRLAVRHEKFFPAPQDFIDRIKGGLTQRALIEWKTQYALCSIVGKKAWDSLPPDEGTVSEIKYRRKQFLEAYEAFAETATPLELAPTPPLPAIAETKPQSIEQEFTTSVESGEEARERIRQILARKGIQLK